MKKKDFEQEMPEEMQLEIITDILKSIEMELKCTDIENEYFAPCDTCFKSRVLLSYDENTRKGIEIGIALVCNQDSRMIKEWLQHIRFINTRNEFEVECI